MYSHVHTVIEAACRTTPSLRLDFWHNESPRYYTTVTADDQRYSVRPDAFCQISAIGPPSSYAGNAIISVIARPVFAKRPCASVRGRVVLGICFSMCNNSY